MRDHADVVELIGRSVTLKRAGRSYKGLCPFHDEKTPSFNVNPDRGSFYCFGCQEGGDAFAFLMKTENLSFVEAVRSLAKDCGIEVPETGSEAGGGISEKIYAANAAMLDHYQGELEVAGNPGAAYLRERGIDDKAVSRFKIGFAPDAWDTAVNVLHKARVPIEVAEKAGLVAARERGGHYDRLRGRVLFPIEDIRGRVLGFGGRAIGAGQEPKYLNTPESPVFHKREAFYGFPAALEPIRKKGRVVVVEGYFDQIAMCLAGIGEALATCGTSLTAEHARGLRRRTRTVVLLFDGDSAGERAMLRALEALLPAGLRVRAAMLPEGDDPDTLLQREGAEALRELVDRAPAALEVAIDRAVAAGCETPWEKADAVASVAPLLALVTSAIERSEYCARLALAVGTQARHVEAAVLAAARGEDARDAVPVAPRRSGPGERQLLEVARCLIEHSQLADRVLREEIETLAGDAPVVELIAALIERAASPDALDLEGLALQLSDEAGALLRQLAISTERIEEEVATRMIDQTIASLLEDQSKQREREITRKLRTADKQEQQSLFEERNRLLKLRQRRSTQRSPAAHAPMGPPA